MKGKCHKRPRKENNISDIDNMSPAIHPVEESPTFAIPTVMKYEIPKETEFHHAFEVLVSLELEHKNIKFSLKPNLVGDLILSPKTTTQPRSSARSPTSTGRRSRKYH
ncbi:hypothetical protein Hamer_G006106 [Homarus americanus]|uniref:Uncharacterized protein n=1 Tax=Homarus americanus TaxID=6706 RepID=A0A8J5MLZ0_HOMAM|nr:hypothetical protein Hamer_G006106 [Homarus americanus]